MITRRTLIQTTAAVATLAPGLVRPASAASVPLVVPPADPLRAFMRLHSSLAGERFTTIEGIIHGAIPGEAARPLIGFRSLVNIRVTEPQPGIFRTEQREATWLTDLASGEIAHEVVNPYTAETVVPFGYVSPTNVYWFDQFGTYQRELPPVRSGVPERQWSRGGTTLWVSEERRNVFPSGISEADYPRAYNGASRVSVDILTYQARIADFDRAGLSVPVTIHMTTNGPWPFWMLMGRRAGGVIWTGHGEKYATLTQIPEAIRKGCEAVYPGFAAQPFAFPEREFGTAATMKRLRDAGKL